MELQPTWIAPLVSAKGASFQGFDDISIQNQ
jgi:hypothetical protein